MTYVLTAAAALVAIFLISSFAYRAVRNIFNEIVSKSDNYSLEFKDLKNFLIERENVHSGNAILTCKDRIKATEWKRYIKYNLYLDDNFMIVGWGMDKILSEYSKVRIHNSDYIGDDSLRRLIEYEIRHFLKNQKEIKKLQDEERARNREKEAIRNATLYERKLGDIGGLAVAQAKEKEGALSVSDHSD